VPQPCAVQLPYSMVRRDWVESSDMHRGLEASGAGIVASFVMAGGVLAGKFDAGGAGRAAGEPGQPHLAAARECGRRGRARADELGVGAAALAVGFALGNPGVASVLFGATSPDQIAANVSALDLGVEAFQRLDALCGG